MVELQATHTAIQPPNMPGVLWDVGANFVLTAAEQEIRLTRSLEGLAMNALQRSSFVEDTMLAWLGKWGY